MLKFSFLKGKNKPQSLSEYMKKEGMKSQRELAEKLKISDAYLSYLFNGKRKLGRKKALFVHKITGIPLENLIK